MIQETKRSCLDEGMIRTIWPWEMMDYMAVDADGSVGGLLSVWNPKIFSLKDYYSNRNLIILSGMKWNLLITYFLTVIWYGNCGLKFWIGGICLGLYLGLLEAFWSGGLV
ncbi:unnamed protein product [Camellia sinensis]